MVRFLFYGYEIETISIEKSLFDIVEKITGMQTLSELFHQLHIKPDEVEGFISFLIETVLIIPEKSGTPNSE